MEERKKPGALSRAGLVLLLLALAVTCYLSVGLPDLSLGLGRWGLYTTDSESQYLAAAYLQTDTRDLLITDRSWTPEDGALVLYTLEGRRTVDLYDDLLGRPVLAAEGSFTTPEQVTHILREGGTLLSFLHQWRWIVWGATGALVLLLLVLRLTANIRWRRRQQRLMRKSFQLYGEKYDQEEEELEY